MALAYAGMCAGLIVFHTCLVLGAPWGDLTQGGANPGILPLSARAFAALSAVLLAGMALSIMSHAGLWPSWPRWTVWVSLTIQGVTTVLNWITPSPRERRLWGPYVTVMTALALGVMVF